MSVFTPVDPTTLANFLAAYNIEELTGFQGISDGIENTNYRLNTTQGRFILTLFESSSDDEIRFSLGLMTHLAHRHDYYARPLQNQQGQRLGRLAGKPAVLVNCLAGASITKPEPEHCRQIGTTLAQLHIDTADLPDQRSNPRGPQWREALAKRLRPGLTGPEQALLDDELLNQSAVDLAQLPQGMIHADLFRDNVLFEDNSLTGVIDLYNCGRDSLLYDLAITANDWCTDEDGRFDEPRLTALLSAYHQTRPISDSESRHWPITLRAAALRFWLSRLRNLHFPRTGELTRQKDPKVFQDLLLLHRENRPKWPL